MRLSANAFALGLAVVGLLLSAPSSAQGQETQEAPQLYDDSGVYVYASFFKIPWPKVDSLLKLNRVLPAVREQAKELGCYLDRRMLIHHTGDEHNVVFMTYFSSWDDLTPGRGCQARAFDAAVPDSAQRAAINEGNEWVFGDAAHQDIIYWQPYPE